MQPTIFVRNGFYFIFCFLIAPLSQTFCTQEIYDFFASRRFFFKFCAFDWRRTLTTARLMLVLRLCICAMLVKKTYDFSENGRNMAVAFNYQANCCYIKGTEQRQALVWNSRTQNMSQMATLGPQIWSFSHVPSQFLARFRGIAYHSRQFCGDIYRDCERLYSKFALVTGRKLPSSVARLTRKCKTSRTQNHPTNVEPGMAKKS